MRKVPLALYITLLLLPQASGVPLIGQAAAQTQPKSQAQPREALYLKCRSEIFRKYGQPGIQYSYGPKYRVLPYTAGSLIDQCVANGGRVN
jgi:hypothetical protein